MVTSLGNSNQSQKRNTETIIVQCKKKWEQRLTAIVNTQFGSVTSDQNTLNEKEMTKIKNDNLDITSDSGASDHMGPHKALSEILDEVEEVVFELANWKKGTSRLTDVVCVGTRSVILKLR